MVPDELCQFSLSFERVLRLPLIGHNDVLLFRHNALLARMSEDVKDG